jgi:hypothetical protein
MLFGGRAAAAFTRQRNAVDGAIPGTVRLTGHHMALVRRPIRPFELEQPAVRQEVQGQEAETPAQHVIYIWVRKTLDWGDEDVALAQLVDVMKPKVQLWNATFDMTYQRFRYRVGQIADLNHSMVEGAVRAPEDEIPDGATVLPVDDDDWFAPHAARVLERELVPGISGCVWPSRWIEVPIDLNHRLHMIRRRLLPATPGKWICTTNNYAVVKTPGAQPLLDSHIQASRWFEGQLKSEGGSVKRIDTELSVANRNLGSQTTLAHLRPTIDRAKLLRKYRSYKHLYHRPPPRELNWCRPYLKQMSELMADLNVREVTGRRSLS